MSLFRNTYELTGHKFKIPIELFLCLKNDSKGHMYQKVGPFTKAYSSVNISYTSRWKVNTFDCLGNLCQIQTTPIYKSD